MELKKATTDGTSEILNLEFEKIESFCFQSENKWS